MKALDDAIRIAGSANKLASAIGVSGMAVSQWKSKGQFLLPVYCKFSVSLELRHMNYAQTFIPIQQMAYLYRGFNDATCDV